GADARGARLVDELAPELEAVVLVLAGQPPHLLAADGLDHARRRLVHVARLVELDVRPLPVEAQDGDAVAVDHAWIELAVAVLVREHLAPAGEAHDRAV